MESLLTSGEAVGRQARAGDVGPDARGDRSGALHLQPFLRQAGPRHRGGPGATGRRGHAGERAGDGARSGRRDGREDRFGGRDAGRLPRRRHGRRRGLRRRRRRLEDGQARQRQDQEEGRAPRRRRSSSRPIPTSWRRSPSRARSGRRWWWALPPRPRTWSPTRSRSGRRKGCDWIVANDVSPATGTFGGERNTVHLISAEGVEDWPTLSKDGSPCSWPAPSRCISHDRRSAEAAE